MNSERIKTQSNIALFQVCFCLVLFHTMIVNRLFSATSTFQFTTTISPLMEGNIGSEYVN